MDAEALVLASAVRSAVVTREAVVERGALDALPSIAARLLSTRTCLLVADENTYAAAGAAISARLRSIDGHATEPLILPAQPYLKPAVDTARQIAEQLRRPGAAAIALGSGVINDLVKYAASLASAPYVCVATAASMDGYAASGAALVEQGFKRTFACPPPVAVVADLDIVVRAPPAMAAWGYGDLAGKVVAGADWILADALGEDPVDPGALGLVQENLRGWLAEPARVAASDPTALRRLMHGLLVSGFAMQAHGSSRPASGSDHQFAHLWEMEGIAVDGAPASHGVCVGLGCVSILALYEWLAAQDVGSIDIARALGAQPSAERLKDEVAAAFPAAHLAESAWSETLAKRPTPERLQRRLTRLRQAWPALRAHLRAELPSAAAVQDWLAACGGCGHPAEIGIDAAKHAADYRRARLIRRRYTVLDLLSDVGWLDAAIGALFARDGFWGRQDRLRMSRAQTR